MKTKPIRHSILAVLLSLLASGQSHAAGFALIENSASGQGNAFAGAAATASDASTIWFNPAGMMKLQQDQIVAAGHIVSPGASFSNNNSTGAAALGSPSLSGNNDDGGLDALVANFYWLKDIGDGMKFGFGVTTPFGLATKYDDSWVGRYHAVESDLKTINFNPSIAYQVDESLSVGGGINLMLANVVFTNVIDFGALCYAVLTPGTCNSQGNIPQSADGFANLEADNFNNLSWGINLGLLYDINDSLTLGVAWRSETKIEVEGDAVFTVPASAAFIQSGGLFLNTGLRAEVTLPQSLSFSLAQRMDNMKLLADITWTGWSSFDELRIRYDNALQPDSVTTENWKDTLRVSVGVDYVVDEFWTVRGGIAYDETPVPDATRRTPRIPGNSRRWLSLGAGYRISNELLIDVGYSHLFISDTTINNTFESSVPTLASTLSGSYSASVDILSAQLSWNY